MAHKFVIKLTDLGLVYLWCLCWLVTYSNILVNVLVVKVLVR